MVSGSMKVRGQEQIEKENQWGNQLMQVYLEMITVHVCLQLILLLTAVSYMPVYEMNVNVDNCVCMCSAAEIEQLQLIAKKNDLIVIPLIQTFGHFEVYFQSVFLNNRLMSSLHLLT